MASKAAIAALGAGCIALMVGYGLRPSPRAVSRLQPAADTLPPPAAPNSDVTRELSLVKAELAGLKEQVAQRAAAAPPPVAEPAVLEPAASPRPVTAEAAQTHFDQVFEQEPLDAGWARAEEQSIAAFIQREGGEGSSLESISCRSSMCRLSLRFSDDHGRDAFKLKLGTPPLNHGGFYKEEGDTRLAYYASREGHTLPAVPTED